MKQNFFWFFWCLLRRNMYSFYQICVNILTICGAFPNNKKGPKGAKISWRAACVPRAALWPPLVYTLPIIVILAKKIWHRSSSSCRRRPLHISIYEYALRRCRCRCYCDDPMFKQVREKKVGKMKTNRSLRKHWETWASMIALDWKWILNRLKTSSLATSQRFQYQFFCITDICKYSTYDSCSTKPLFLSFKMCFSIVI